MTLPSVAAAIKHLRVFSGPKQPTIPARKASHEQEWHRHFRIDGRGYIEHLHAFDYTLRRQSHGHAGLRAVEVMR